MGSKNVTYKFLDDFFLHVISITQKQCKQFETTSRKYLSGISCFSEKKNLKRTTLT